MRSSSTGLLALALVTCSAASVHAQPASSATAAAPAQRARVSEVRGGVRALGPVVQRCADRHEPWASASERGGSRLRLRVWLEPSGRFTLEVPELEGRNDTDLPPRERLNLTRLHSCLRARVTAAIRHYLRPFRGRRQKIEHAFRIRRPGPPPSEASLVSQVSARRTALLACVPGAGSGTEAEELVVRAVLGTDGVVHLTGLAVPASVPFSMAARCVADEIGQISLGRVTSARRFEAVLRYRFSAPPTAPE